MTADAEPRYYPVAFPDISAAESDRVQTAVRSTWISSIGPFLEEFETRFAQECAAAEAIACANGTVALHLILAALGLGPGDEVIVPSMTYVATANTVVYTGATPVFVDVSPDTWCLDPAQVESAITPRTAAIVAVHLYGHPADMDALASLAERNGLALVEDAAEAPFATYRGRVTGGLGVAASFSFYGNKIITSGEGGAVTTNDPALATRIRLLRGQGLDPGRRYYHVVVGYNYRLTNIAAAMLCGQLSRRRELLTRRRSLFAAYDAAIAGCDRIALQPIAKWAERAPWMYTLLLRDADSATRDLVMAGLAERRVETRPMFVPVHRMPPYAGTARSALPVTDALGAQGLSLPTSSTYTPADAEEIAARLLQVLDSP
jgi:perosamine synthetase